jgi:hypothetical protein
MIRTLLVTAFSICAFAQPPESARFRIDAPLRAGSSTLPAGDYTVGRMNTASNIPVLSFQSSNGTSIMIVVDRGEPIYGDYATAPRFLFDTESDGVRRLTGIQFAGHAMAYLVPSQK